MTATLVKAPLQALTEMQPPAAAHSVAARGVIHLIEDNPVMCEAARAVFEYAGWDVLDYISAEDFLAVPRPAGDACLVLDVMLPGMNGLSLLEILRRESSRVPAIMLTGRGDAAAAVLALKAGAADFIEKPADPTVLLASVANAVDFARHVRARDASRAAAKACFAKLTPREHDVMRMVLDGAPNKNIAADLGINQRTVENHRANVMRKTGAASLPALVQLFFEASASD